MPNLQTLLIAALSFALGAVFVSYKLAPASAQSQRTFRECYFMKTWYANGGQVASKLARVPPGWTPVGGSGAGSAVGVVLCR